MSQCHRLRSLAQALVSKRTSACPARAPVRTRWLPHVLSPLLAPRPVTDRRAGCAVHSAPRFAPRRSRWWWWCCCATHHRHPISPLKSAVSKFISGPFSLCIIFKLGRKRLWLAAIISTPPSLSSLPPLLFFPHLHSKLHRRTSTMSHPTPPNPSGSPNSGGPTVAPPPLPIGW